MKPLSVTTVAFIACVFAVGLSYWAIPYSKVNLPDALFGPGLAVVVLAAALLCGLRILALWRCTWVMGASLPAAVMARVLVEGLRDPTSHNLWPLEIVIAAFVGFACAVAGAIVGRLIAVTLRSE